MAKKSVTLVEVGLRDGLQNEKTIMSVIDRIEMAQLLAAAGARRLEVGAFVRSDKVPQMAGSMEVVEGILSLQKEKKISKDIDLSVLVPNEKGMMDAIASGVQEVAIFASCSESFSLKNINCSIKESFERFAPVMKLAKKHKVRVRGYLSTCFGCPFEGDVPEARVVQLTRQMADLGVFEISIGDTIGVANPAQVERLFKKLFKVVPTRKLAGHFHDTRGQALANILTAWNLGLRVFDTSVGGLGGCPYAPGATGNVSTEDVVYMFQGMGVETGFDLGRLVAMNSWVEQKVSHPLPTKAGRAGALKPLGAVKERILR